MSGGAVVSGGAVSVTAGGVDGGETGLYSLPPVSSHITAAMIMRT
jgi:hypothetical protein